MSMFRTKQTFRATPLCFLILHICVQHVLIPLSPPCGERRRCYLSSTHRTADRTSFTDNRRTGGDAFFHCLAVFSLLSEYVVVCGYCTRDQPDFNMSRVHTLSINYSFTEKMACGSCLKDDISCGQ